jgi:hypothetical protein
MDQITDHIMQAAKQWALASGGRLLLLPEV